MDPTPGPMMNGTRSNTQHLIPSILLLLILLLALGLRFYHLDAQSLWNDEGTSVALAQRDLATIARDAAQDIHPPLYYWLLSGWVRLFGPSELAVRSLSAMLGLVLVALVYILGRLLAGRWAGLAAAFLAAISPFQVYYSQEARMYMLLAVLTAGLVLALVRYVSRASVSALVALVLLEAAGLYTHYSFLFVLLIVNGAYALWLALTWRRDAQGRRIVRWLLGQVAVVLLYLPWLPIAIRQLTTWPSPTQTTPFFPALFDTWRWLIFGPASETGQVVLPLLVMGFLAALGLVSLLVGRGERSVLEDRWSASLLLLWLCLPVALMFILGLYREAYLKFLLVTSPAVVFLLALGLPRPLSARPRIMRILPLLAYLATAFLVVYPSALALHRYYTDPALARDDYRAIAAYVDAVGRPGDAVLLNAPGQQEVFAYYYPTATHRTDLPVYPLPQDRPLAPVATEAALQALARPGGRVFAVLWATDESDPGRFVEGWLDAHAYKALDSWYGNVRLVVYAVPDRAPEAPDRLLDVPLRNPDTGDEVTLLGYSLLDERLAAGDIAQITLFWRAGNTPGTRYKVFVHVLDGGNQIVGQRDAEPGGGARLTTLWQPGETVVDNYGVPIHPATPPGAYRVEVGMYDPATGQRLLTPDGEGQVWLDPLAVDRPPIAAPLAALGMQYSADAQFGELSLLGYDAHRLGFAHEPGVPLRPGEVLHVNLYWRAETQPSGGWQVKIGLEDAAGQAWVPIEAEPVAGYPTGRWLAGDVWRGQFNLSLPADLPPGDYRLWIQPIMPGGARPEPFLSNPVIKVR